MNAFDRATGCELPWSPTDYRTRRPMVTKVPVRPAGRVGAGRWCPPPATGRTLAAVVVVVALIVWRRT